MASSRSFEKLFSRLRPEPATKSFRQPRLGFNPDRASKFRGITSLFLGLGLVLSLISCAPRPRPANVILLSLDTTRADFLGCYGKTGAMTPNYDRLASEGFLFEQADASNPVTQASHSTILTGTYPIVHGVRDNGLFHLPDSSLTLAEILKSKGYATAAAVGGFPLTVEFGTSQGFDFYDDQLKALHQDARGRPAQRRSPTWYDERPAGNVNDAILPWLRTNLDRPFFVWLHYWDAHEPHIPPPPFNQLFAHDLYSGEIAYADSAFGTILKVLEDSGRLKNTLIVITGDHGEGRRQHHEATHAFLAYQTTLQVPLIIRPVGITGGRKIHQRVGTVDIVPTVLDLLGFEAPPGLQGRSLKNLMTSRNEREVPAADYYAESLSPRLSHGCGELRVFYHGRMKYIFGPRPELFDLEADPEELHNLLGEEKAEGTTLKTELQTFITEHSKKTAADAAHEISEETRRRLEALGYLGSGGSEAPAIRETLNPEGAPPQDRVSLINLESRLRQEIGGGRWDLAAKTASKLVNEAPENPFYSAQLALALLRLDRLQESLDVIRRVPSISGGNQGIFLQVASALCAREQCAEGRSIVERILKVEDSAEAELALARIALHLEDDQGFDQAIARALALKPENLEARMERGRNLAVRGRLDDALKDFEWALGKYPAYAGAHIEVGRILASQGKPEEALSEFQLGISLEPGACQAQLDRLGLLLRQRRDSEVEEAWRLMKKTCRDVELLTQAKALVEAP